MIDGEARRYAAVLGRRHFEGTVTLEALFEHFGSSEDPLICALLEAAAHQPSRGFAGVSQEQWEKDFWLPVSAVLSELEKGLEGRAPTTRVYPRSDLAGVVGWSAFALFAGACAAEYAIGLWKLLQNADTLPLWHTALKSLGVAVTATASWAGIRVALFRLHLYRTRNTPYGESEGRAG